MKTEPLIIERTLKAPVQKVWQAITDNAQMKKWYFDIAEFEPVVGFKFQFYGGSEYLHLCEVKEVVPQKKLSYSWTYEKEPGESLVTIELNPVGDNETRLTLTHTGLESFKAGGDFARESFQKGWTQIIGTNLKNFIEQ